MSDYTADIFQKKTVNVIMVIIETLFVAVAEVMRLLLSEVMNG